MNSYTPRHYSATMLLQVGWLLHNAARALWNLAERLDARIAARQKAADDRRLLSEMSERELRDIGISRAELLAIGGGWYFHRHEIVRAADRMAGEMIGC
jgi:uncharacterized protein YjiS (DUF1127 family)